MNPMEMQEEQTEPVDNPAEEAGEAQPGKGVDLDAIRAKITIDPQVKPLYEKALVSGRRLMFSKETAQQNKEYLSGPGPMDQKLADGVIAVVYMLWQRSNQSLNPLIIVPLTLALTLDAFEFIQEAGHPEATEQTLGNAVQMATEGIMQKFNVPTDQIAALVKKNVQTIQQASQQAQPGILGG